MANKDSQEKIKQLEEKNPYALFSLGFSSIVSAYLLFFNLSFFYYEIISKIIIIFLIIFSYFGCFYPSINYYFNKKRDLLYLSIGILLIPSNLIWYLLFHGWFFKISFALAFFMSIYFLTIGTIQIYSRLIKEQYENDGKALIKFVLLFLSEVLTILLTFLQIRFLL